MTPRPSLGYEVDDVEAVHERLKPAGYQESTPVLSGFLWVLFPERFYKKVTPEQHAKDRKRFRIFGVVIVALGLVLLALPRK
jgi:uncharacterized protein YjeT (DUF2065 family)